MDLENLECLKKAYEKQFLIMRRAFGIRNTANQVADREVKKFNEIKEQIKKLREKMK